MVVRAIEITYVFLPPPIFPITCTFYSFGKFSLVLARHIYKNTPALQAMGIPECLLNTYVKKLLIASLGNRKRRIEKNDATLSA